jgi:hypothetical protein
MLRVFITDMNGQPLMDGEPVERHLTGVNWTTLWPKGYGVMAARLSRDIMTRNPVSAGYGIKIQWNGRSVYEGRLNAPRQSRNGLDQSAALSGSGWYTLLAERQLRKRWIDLAGVSYLEAPTARLLLEEQARSSITYGQKEIRIIPIDRTVNATTEEQVHLEYVLPVGTVRRVKFGFTGRSGEGFDIEVWNDDQAASEASALVLGSVPTGGSYDHVFIQGNTLSYTLRIHPHVDDEYDPNDWLLFSSLETHANYHPAHSAYASPAYTTQEILEDVYLYLRETSLSADVDRLGFSGVKMTNFTTLDDGFETGDSLIQRLFRYGGTSDGINDQTLGFCVWGSDESSDGRPKAYVTVRDTDDYEFIVDPSDRGVTFQPEESESALYNYIVVKYEDDSDRTRYLTPADDADLSDPASIARYGKRMVVLNGGACDASAAAGMGRRALAFHKDLLDRVSMSVTGMIKTKAGLTVPACYVRSGDRVRVKGYQGGKTYFIRTTGFDAETQVLTMSSDLPPLMIETMVSRQSIE